MIVLVSMTAEREGKTLYFKQMTGIGPMTTRNLAEAATFESPEAARQSPACFHMLSFFDARETEPRTAA